MQIQKSKYKNRGKEGSDNKLFMEPYMIKKINKAIYDLSFLLERGYSEKSSKKIIGNRYKLNLRQMKAVAGMAASVSSLEIRSKKELKANELKGKTIFIDGFNVLIIMESILSNAFIFKGRDACYRDLSTVHGSYKQVNQTNKALMIVGEYLNSLKIEKAIWVFDQPVSNSGRMKTLLSKMAEEHNYNWKIILDYNPDKYLVNSKQICVSSDAWITQNCISWYNLIENLFKNKLISNNFIIDYTEET